MNVATQRSVGDEMDSVYYSNDLDWRNSFAVNNGSSNEPFAMLSSHRMEYPLHELVYLITLLAFAIHFSSRAFI